MRLILWSWILLFFWPFCIVAHDGFKSALNRSVRRAKSSRYSGSGTLKSSGGDRRGLRETTAEDFVHDSSECSEYWAAWPAVHEKAIASGRVIVYDLFPSVGNTFVFLGVLIRLARHLEVGLILRWKAFQGFRTAFDAAEIGWDIDAAHFAQQASAIKLENNPRGGLNAMEYEDGLMILSDTQTEQLGLVLGISGMSAAQIALKIDRGLIRRRLLKTIGARGRAGIPMEVCAWNMLLKRSKSTMADLQKYRPEALAGGASGSRGESAAYAAWHIRTEEGEKYGWYHPVYPHIVKKPPGKVCPEYTAIMERAAVACPRLFHGGADQIPIFIATNSRSMASNCTAYAAERSRTVTYVDMGLPGSETHTEFSPRAELAAANAFVDFLLLLDAKMIIRTSSSFSGTISSIKGLECRDEPSGLSNPLSLCLPADC